MRKHFLAWFGPAAWCALFASMAIAFLGSGSPPNRDILDLARLLRDIGAVGIVFWAMGVVVWIKKRI